MSRTDKVGAVLVLCAVLVSAAVSQAEMKPAELPPASYRGLQYVDSQGCAFLRAGTDADPVWVPRVSAGGAPMCDNPPSGNRVPIAGEAGADGAGPVPDAAPTATAPAAKTKPVERTPPVATGGYIVAVGSFGVSENADRALARLNELGFPAARGWLQGGGSGLVTVFAGPYESAADAKAALAALQEKGFPNAVVLSL